MPQFPGWARPQADAPRDTLLVQAAGALAALQGAAGAVGDWRGAWRDRLALRAAVGSLKAIGRPETEVALRDAVHHREAATDPGPGGRMVELWRAFARRSPPDTEDEMALAAMRFGFAWGDDLQALWRVREDITAAESPLTAAVQLVTAPVPLKRESLPLAYLMADAVLAARTRWPLGVPLLATAPTKALTPLGGAGGNREIALWQAQHWLAYGRAAAAAWDLAVALSDRAAALTSVEGLRAKGATVIIAALLANDAVRAGGPDTKVSEALTITQRARRRFLETLEQRKLIRELTGRATSRLYGL